VTTTHFNDGTTATGQIPLQERLDVTFCEPGIYSPATSPVNNNIAKLGAP
jgi:hypothetical protein